MPSPTYLLIRQAVIDKKPIIATYQGHVRQLCPHAIGMKRDEKKRDREKVLVYQFGGHSSKPLAPDGSPDNFRCFFIDKMSNVAAVDGAWHTVREFLLKGEDQECIDRVD